MSFNEYWRQKTVRDVLQAELGNVSVDELEAVIAAMGRGQTISTVVAALRQARSVGEAQERMAQACQQLQTANSLRVAQPDYGTLGRGSGYATAVGSNGYYVTMDSNDAVVQAHDGDTYNDKEEARPMATFKFQVNEEIFTVETPLISAMKMDRIKQVAGLKATEKLYETRKIDGSQVSELVEVSDALVLDKVGGSGGTITVARFVTK